MGRSSRLQISSIDTNKTFQRGCKASLARYLGPNNKFAHTLHLISL